MGGAGYCFELQVWEVQNDILYVPNLFAMILLFADITILSKLNE